MTNKNAQTYQQYRDELAAAARWSHPDYRTSAIAKERSRRVTEARKRLRSAVPAEVPASGQSTVEYMNRLRPISADDVAVSDFEWRQALTLLESGRVLAQVIHSANPARLRAIAANVETLPDTLNSTDPDGVVQEVRSLVFDRLVELGDPEPVKIAQEHRRHATASAWREFLLAALEGEPSLAQKSNLCRLDPEGWARLDRTEKVLEDIDTSAEVRRLDTMVVSGMLEV